MERQICLTISYDGTSYAGFQQQENAIAVESVLKEALSKIAGHTVTLLAASRTDAGVHALGQTATFFLRGRIPTAHICNAVNGILPRDIVVTEAKEMPASFHCRYMAVGKHYRYTVRNAPQPSPFDYNYAFFYGGKLDENKMRQLIPSLLGEHDFEAFTAAHSGRESFVRRLDQITVTREGDYLYFDFWGNAFLYKMVRSISGALIDVGRGHLSAERVETALKEKDRSLLGLTAPARGLNLIKIYYNDDYYLDKNKTIS